MWHAGAGQGTGGAAPNVANQYVVFDLGANYDLTSAYLWQMIQNNNLGRGIKEFALYGSSASMATPYPANPPLSGFTQILGTSTLAQVTGTSANPNPAVTQSFSLTGAANVRTIYLDIISAHSGLTNDYVGLSEIKFEGTPVPPPPATLYNWNTTANAAWQTGESWSPSGGPPTSNDHASFAIAGAYTVLVTSTPAVRNLNVSAGDVTLTMFNNAATLQVANINVSGGKLTVPGLIGRASLPGVLNYTSSLNITDGGQVVSIGDSWGGVSVGTDGATVQATVSGTGSSLSSASGFYVGAGGNGTLDITAGGKVTSAGILFAGSYGGTGNITVDGTHSALVVSSDNLLIGYGSNGGTPGTASLTVTNGGQVSNAAQIQIGAYGGNGSVIVGKSDGTDAGNSKLLGNILYVTIGATTGGSLTVNPGGSVELTGALYNTTNSGKINLAGGTIKTNLFVLNAASNMNWTAGTLWLTGGTSSASSTTSTLTVPTAGILKGNGTINSHVTSLGTISPGNDSVATLATRNLTIGNNSAAGTRGTFAADIDFATSTADLLNVTGTVNLTNAALDLSLLNLPTSLSTPLTFLLINNDGSDAVTGMFASINLGSFSSFQYSMNYAFSGVALNGTGTGNDVAITFTVVPEPGTLFLLLTSTGLLVQRRRSRSVV